MQVYKSPFPVCPSSDLLYNYDIVVELQRDTTLPYRDRLKTLPSEFANSDVELTYNNEMLTNQELNTPA